MSNSTGAVRRSGLAMVATVAIVALIAALFAVLTGGTASSSAAATITTTSSATTTATPTESPSPTTTDSPTETVSPSPTPSGPVYPVAQGWVDQPNGVQYNISSDGYVSFWTTRESNYGMLRWETSALPSDSGMSFWYGDPPKRVKFLRCGVSAQISISGYRYAETRTLPAWPCKPSKKVDIIKVKKVSASRVKVYGRTGMVSHLRAGRLVVFDATKSTRRYCAWVNAYGRLKYTRRVNGACPTASAPTASNLPKTTSWGRVLKLPRRHSLKVIALVRYTDGATRRDAVSVRLR